jgi:hypothetical protein
MTQKKGIRKMLPFMSRTPDLGAEILKVLRCCPTADVDEPAGQFRSRAGPAIRLMTRCFGSVLKSGPRD